VYSTGVHVQTYRVQFLALLTNQLTQQFDAAGSSSEAVTQLFNKFAAFMEPEGSLPCQQQPETGPYPEPDASSPHLPTIFP